MSILDRILDKKREELAEAKRRVSVEDLRLQAGDAPPAQNFRAAFRGGTLPRPRIIAEVKRRSPSAGAIREGAHAVEIAQQYMRAGAAAISVLTDETFFGGSLADLSAVRAGTRVPVLRKDFLIDPYEVVRSRAAGADAVLLIVAALSPSLLAELMGETKALGMAALVEVHSEDEMAVALSAQADVVGVNHRNLKTFEVDTGLSVRLRKSVPDEVVLIAESGIGSADDMRRLAAAKIDGALVGESLMRAPDIGVALKALLAGCS